MLSQYSNILVYNYIIQIQKEWNSNSNTEAPGIPNK